MKPSTSLEFIDKICCDFEDFWEFGLSLDNLRSFALGHLSEHSCDFPTLLIEIAQTDVELRWRYIAKLANQTSAQNLPKLISQLETIPSARDYLNLLPSGTLQIDDLRRTLLDAELKSRCKFGDSPSPVQFGIPNDLWESYERYRPVISVSQAGSLKLKTPLVSPMLVGRQGVNEPEPPSFYNSDQKFKLICSPLEDKTISRQQFQVKVVVGRWIQVTNTSKNRHFAISNHSVLAPEETALIKVPCTIDLDPIKLNIDHPIFEN